MVERVRKPVIILLCMAVMLSTTYLAADTSNDVTGQPVISEKTAYIVSTPFRINSNAEFASMAASEGWPGDGSQATPYIIDNYDINGTGYGYCVYIGNTTNYFTIQNCYLHEANGVGIAYYFSDSSIILYNVQNGNVANNIALLNNWHGIYLYSSSSNTITNNTASSNKYYGIYLSYSSSNTITNNTASSNTYYGVYLRYSNSNTIANNTISSNIEDGIHIISSNSNIIVSNIASSNIGDGIYIESSSSNTLMNNTIVDDGIVIFGNSIAYWNTHTIDTSNTVNGKPVQYWKNHTSGTVPLGAGQVILANCTNVIVENQNVSEGSAGILLGFSSNNTISNNTASSNNEYGIYLYSSNSNHIYHNNIIDNSNQAYDNRNNNWWNASYPSGGNYWSDYTGIDAKSGPNQDQPGCDGIGDTPYIIDADSRDSYPFIGEPKIAVTIPADNALYVSPSSGIYVIQFNTVMNKYAGTISTNLPNAVWMWSADGVWYNGTYGTLQNFTTYYVNLTAGGFVNWAGSPLAGDTQKNFTTSDEMHPAPFRINSNVEFASMATSRNWCGDGSQGNPYVIENYDINGTGYGYCIYIGNTTVYFEVRNCYLHEASGNFAMYYDNSGLDFYTVKNGTVANNNATSNYGHGIYLYFSSNNTIVNNTFSSNSYNGIFPYHSTSNTIANNTASSNNANGIFLSFSSSNTIANNSVSNNSGQAIYLSSSNNNNTIVNNIVSNNNYGIYLEWESNGNTIVNNTVSSNNWVGIQLVFSSSNTIYHNNIINNAYRQAYDDRDNNFWNASYPTGGNYWSDYTGVDVNSGSLQDQSGSDGIGDTPNVFGVGRQDNYPLMAPNGGTQYNFTLQQGWNLISIPLIQTNESLNKVLTSIAGKWDVIQTYNSTDTVHWKSNNTFKPDSLNDLKTIDHKIGIWIHMTEPDVVLTVYGYIPTSTSIPFKAGWNLVGYPTLNTTTTVADALWGTGADKVEVCDPTDPYRTKEVGSTYLMKPGEGYWVHVPADSIWTVNW